MACCEAQQPEQERLVRNELAAPVAPLAPIGLPVAASVVTIDEPRRLSARAHEHAARAVPTAPPYLTTHAFLI